jgi:diguanylate cyclase (GGDEF)-like protein
MPPLVRPLGCPAEKDDCPVLSEFLGLQEECRRLQELAQTDSLTGLYNRRYLMKSLDQEMERTRRTGLPTSLIMLDLDYFKRFNDTYGHQFGDIVLQRVALIFKDNVRRLDIPCRYGGDEFALLLPGTRLPQAVLLAERLKEILAQSREKLQERPAQVTASFGVDTFTGREDMAPETFLQHTDRWLFVAKARGRNIVCHSDLEQVAPEVGLTPEERRAFLFPTTSHNDRAGGSYG